MNSCDLSDSQIRRDLRDWLSASDPSIKHNNVQKVHHRRTAEWFTGGKVFGKWKSTGSLLWVHGLRTHPFFVYFPAADKILILQREQERPSCGMRYYVLFHLDYLLISSISSTIIKNIQDECQTGLAILTFYYFDFRLAKEQDTRGFLSSLLIQLSVQSDEFLQILSVLNLSHRHSPLQQPSEDELLLCLKEMLKLPGQGELYIVVDALDECQDSTGIRTTRQQVLDIMKELVDLKISHLHLCVTSRFEIHIRWVLEPLGPDSVSLHDQRGQREDIARYVKEIVESDAEMRLWPEDKRKLVISTLSEKGCGM